MSNKVLITNDQNTVKIPSGLRILIRRSCNAVLDFENFDGPAEISVTFVDNNRIHELNLQYRDKDSATDVLSFPLGENGVYDIDEDNGCKILGDIVISYHLSCPVRNRRRYYDKILIGSHKRTLQIRNQIRHILISSVCLFLCTFKYDFLNAYRYIRKIFSRRNHIILNVLKSNRNRSIPFKRNPSGQHFKKHNAE